MGDISTHADIAKEVRALLPSAEQRAFFEIGNFLTDVSQFRDPYAHIGAKKRIWEAGRAAKPGAFIFGALDLIAGLDNYLDALMGVPGAGPTAGPEGDPATWRPDDGLLAQWFRDVILVLSADRFRAQGVGKQDFLGVFDRRFTQYYPHEHVDFPPWPHGSALGGARGPVSEVDAGGGKKRLLLQYLEDQLVYVADLLTRVEEEWAKVAATPDNAAERRHLIALFGHASHAAEDFFFHSAFAETAWARANPDTPAPTRPLAPPSPEELESFGPPVSDVHRQRSNHRRLRAPQANGDDTALSTETSAAATHMYTGQFGGNDIFFTLVDAIGHLATAAPSPGEPPHLAAFRETFRAALFGTEEEQAAALATHHERLVSGFYVRAAEAGKSLGLAEQFEVDAVRRACEHDLDLANRFSMIALGDTPMGIVGMLMKLMSNAREAVKASAERSAAIDADNAVSVNDDRSDNGAPGENIGSHSLMAKDSVRKEPLRVEAVNLATFAATYLAKRMVERTPAATPTDPDKGVDWADILRHFVCHPSQAKKDGDTPWWQPVLASIDPRPPELHTLRLIAATDADTAANEPHKRELERQYEALSSVVEAEFRSAVNGSFVLDNTLTGLILGGVSGLVSGLVNGAIDGDPESSLGAGGLGLLAGGAFGAAASVLLTGAGVALNESGGAVVGAATGWATAPVGAWLIADAIADAVKPDP